MCDFRAAADHAPAGLKPSSVRVDDLLQTIMETAENLTMETAPSLTLVPPPAHRDETGLTRRETAELAKAEQIIAAARETPYAQKLLECEITPEFLDELTLRIAACRQCGSDALKQRRKVRGVVRSRLAVQGELVKCLREMQSAARVKFGVSEPLRLKAYAIGMEIDMSMLVLYACAHLILHNAATDALPGITAGKIAAGNATLREWFDVRVEKDRENADGVGLTARRREAMKEINAQRMQIQFAASLMWPERVPENGEARTRFYLPLNRPYTG